MVTDMKDTHCLCTYSPISYESFIKTSRFRITDVVAYLWLIFVNKKDSEFACPFLGFRQYYVYIMLVVSLIRHVHVRRYVQKLVLKYLKVVAHEDWWAWVLE